MSFDFFNLTADNIKMSKMLANLDSANCHRQIEQFDKFFGINVFGKSHVTGKISTKHYQKRNKWIRLFFRKSKFSKNQPKKSPRNRTQNICFSTFYIHNKDKFLEMKCINIFIDSLSRWNRIRRFLLTPTILMMIGSSSLAQESHWFPFFSKFLPF